MCSRGLPGLAGIVLLTPMLAAAVPPSDFTLEAPGRTFRLSEARGRFVAVHFLLKTDCPLCIRTIVDYVREGPSIAGVVHLFVKPDGDTDVARFREEVEGVARGAIVYRDPDAKLAARLDIPDGYRFHGQTVRHPALVVFGPDGREVFRHVGRDNTDRLPFAEFARRIESLTVNPALATFNVETGRPAIDGYDPVGYFKGTAAKGRSELSSRYRGVTYLFANEDNRRRFAEEPETFVPAYGGWCATAMAEGKKVEVDPSNFKITNGRLLLFYKGWLGNALKDWNKDEPGLMKRADAEWRRLAPADGPLGANP